MTKSPVKIESKSGASPYQDMIFGFITKLSALIVLFVLLGIVISLFINAWPALKNFGPGFFFDAHWDINREKFGGLISIYGTIVTSLIALLIATPLSFGIAIFLTEICPKFLKRPLGVAVELLAAVPSIIYGMFGLFILHRLLVNIFNPHWQVRWANCLLSEYCFLGQPMELVYCAQELFLQ